MSRIRVADLVAEWVSSELQLDQVFMVTGAGIMHLTDGIAKHDSIEPVCLHHEQAVAMAVEAYSRTSGRIGVAYVSTGPAATNAITGLVGAWQDSVACMFFSGQVKVSETSRNAGIDGLRQFGVQEFDIMPMVQSVTKYSVHVTHAEDILFELGKAKFLSREGRPGPVWLDIPLDIQSSLVDSSQLKKFEPPSREETSPRFSDEVSKFLESFLRSDRPVVVLGQGVRLANCTDGVSDFIRKYRIPVVSTYLGIDSYLPHDDLYIGKIGVKGERAANIVVQKSDLVLVLGASLHVSAIGYNYSQFAPEAEKWIVDIDPTSHLKPTLLDSHFILADVGSFIQELVTQIKIGDSARLNWKPWAVAAGKIKDRFPTHLPEYEQENDGVNIYTIVEEVSKALSPTDVVVSDAGSAFYAVAQGIRLGGANRYITSGAMATMGYSLPAAIGVSFAHQGSRVIAFTGDGSLHQNIQELGQMKFLGLPIVLVVLNNGGYLSIRASQSNYFGGRYIGTDDKSGLGLPDISAISEAYGLRCDRIESLGHLRRALRDLELVREPVVLNVQTPANQAIVPTVSSRLDDEGRMSSRDIHDMTPLIDPSDLESIMAPDWGY